MFERLFKRRKRDTEPGAVPEAATVLAMGSQSGITAVPGAVIGTADNEPEEKQPSESEGAI